MLPFLPKRKQVSVIASVKAPALSSPPEPPTDPLLLHAAEMILAAIATKNPEALSLALKMHFMLCEEEPHVEGPHVPLEE